MKGNDKSKLLFAVGLGLVLSDIIPTPADGLYFHLQQKNKERLEKKEITPEQYWTRDALAYYCLNPIWWLTVLGTSYYIGKTYEQKRNIMLSLIAGGIVVAVINKNVKKDKQFYAQHKLIDTNGN